MEKLEKIIEEIPDQVNAKLGIENKDKLPEGTGSVVVCGMGGSGVIGDLLQVLLPKIDIHVHKDYNLPENTPDNSLFLIISYSGNTKETLSAYEEATSPRQRRAGKAGDKNVAVIAGGGKLLELAQADKIPYIKVPWDKDIPARFNVGHMLGAALEILDRPDPSTSLGASRSNKYNKDLAERLIDKTVLIYTTSELEGLGLFWKEVLNETAKLPAFTNTLPEASHNEIESIGSVTNPFLLFLNNNNLESLAEEKGWEYEVINLDVTGSIQMALTTSLKAAELKNIDPTKTPLIDETKKG